MQWACILTYQVLYSPNLSFPGVFVRIKGFKFIKHSNFLKGRVLAEYHKSPVSLQTSVRSLSGQGYKPESSPHVEGGAAQQTTQSPSLPCSLTQQKSWNS